VEEINGLLRYAEPAHRQTFYSIKWLAVSLMAGVFIYCVIYALFYQKFLSESFNA
jgi:hypothetical protein